MMSIFHWGFSPDLMGIWPGFWTAGPVLDTYYVNVDVEKQDNPLRNLHVVYVSI